ncbi:MAG: hypothetical protein J2P26_07105 [Nocardiopsaceae bacterium]|nr:hypothetical protein [Nocardiopsaceae bacterium]
MSVTPEHEARHRIFKFDPGLYSRAAERVFGIKLAAPPALSELNVDLTETRPVERRADTMLRAEFPAGDAGPILIVESQTEDDKTRRARWPYYIAFVRDKYECQVVFLVVCSSRATARWAREPIEIGEPGAICMTVTPLVLGPDNVPAVMTTGEALADLPFAVLSALVHSDSQGRKKDAILESLASALQTIDVETAAELAEFTEVGLGKTTAGTKWRALMATETYVFASEQRRLGWGEGEAKGEAKAVLRNLKNRGIPVDSHSADRIKACSDVETLDTWLDRSLTIAKIDELFTD